MGLTTVLVKIGKGRCTRRMRFLVDSGATYSLLPERAWRALRLKPLDKVSVVLADGTAIERDLSETWFEFGGSGRTSPVILGQDRDEPLLGAVTLESLGLMLNPLTRELLPMKLMLAGGRSAAPRLLP
ncbi:MAG: aspartyl protease family protein [Planctomycetes bacterium]|nr:aspartyl protease family protein [Planctomycetota bacterium]